MSVSYSTHPSTAVAFGRAAADAGVTLPPELQAALDHLADLVANRPKAPDVSALGHKVADHLGDRAAMTKAYKAAVADLVNGEAAERLSGIIRDAAGGSVIGMIQADRDHLAALFGEAIADDLGTLAETAARLPHDLQVGQAASLTPEAFTAYTLGREALARIRVVVNALDVVYAGAVGQRSLSLAIARALRWVDPGEFDDPAHAFRLSRALDGSVTVGDRNRHLGEFFIPALVLHEGARIAWGTPAEVADRADRLAAGMNLSSPSKVRSA